MPTGSMVWVWVGGGSGGGGVGLMDEAKFDPLPPL